MRLNLALCSWLALAGIGACSSSSTGGAPGNGSDGRIDAAAPAPSGLDAGAAPGTGGAREVGVGPNAQLDAATTSGGGGGGQGGPGGGSGGGSGPDAAPQPDVGPAGDLGVATGTGGAGASDADGSTLDATHVDLPATPASDAGPPRGDAGAGSSSSSYACTLMIGIQATYEWYNVGFETMVDGAAWELIWVHSGFVELWADPKDPVWSTAITSPCAKNPTQPDRIIFVALNFDFNTLAQWTPPVTATVENLKAKYPSAKRIELMSFIRAPGNNACSQAPAKRSTITPAQDQAMAMAAAANPDLVVVAPAFEAKTCGEFNDNPPHPSPAGAAAWAKMMADYYR